VAVAAAVSFDKYPSVFYAFIVTCFIMIALYAAAYFAQRDISKKYYRDAGKSLTPTYKSSFDAASKYLQAIFGVAIIVVLCLMIRAERMTKPAVATISKELDLTTHPRRCRTQGRTINLKSNLKSR
jgi:hypothetical protein